MVRSLASCLPSIPSIWIKIPSHAMNQNTTRFTVIWKLWNSTIVKYKNKMQFWQPPKCPFTLLSRSVNFAYDIIERFNVHMPVRTHRSFCPQSCQRILRIDICFFKPRYPQVCQAEVVVRDEEAVVTQRSYLPKHDPQVKILNILEGRITCFSKDNFLKKKYGHCAL